LLSKPPGSKLAAPGAQLGSTESISTLIKNPLLIVFDAHGNCKEGGWIRGLVENGLLGSSVNVNPNLDVNGMTVKLGAKLLGEMIVNNK